MKQATVIHSILVMLLLALPGCGKQEEQTAGPQLDATPARQEAPAYHFAIHPLHNPAKLSEAYQPLIDFLNERIRSCRFSLEASRDYASFEEKYRVRTPEFILPNPWQTLQAETAGYRVIAMAGAPKDFKGVFVVRKDSGIKQPADLIGKAVSYPSPTALAACIMPQYYLFTHGVKVMTDLDNRYVGSQESSIMNVFMGQTAAGATWPPPWRAFQKQHPDEAEALTVIWETESLVNNSVMSRDDMPAALQGQIRDALTSLDQTPAGKTILANMETARFLPATNEDYEAVRRYVSRFESEVRPVKKQ